MLNKYFILLFPLALLSVKDQRFPCTQCPRDFSKPQALKWHEDWHNSPPEIPNYLSLLEERRARATEELPVTKARKKKSKKWLSVKATINKGNPSKGKAVAVKVDKGPASQDYPCKQCDEAFSTFHSLRLHMGKEHSDINCGCGKPFAQWKDYVSHYWKCKEVKDD